MGRQIDEWKMNKNYGDGNGMKLLVHNLVRAFMVFVSNNSSQSNTSEESVILVGYAFMRFLLPSNVIVL